MRDKYNRKIDYARISLTNKCNLNCRYCMPSNQKECHSTLSKEKYFNIIDSLSNLGFKKVRFTGGEPLLIKYIDELVEYSSKTIKDIGITTNAILLDKHIDSLVNSGLKRINISLDTLDKDKYKKLSGSDYLDKVLNNIKLAKSKGLKVKINTVLLKGINHDEIKDVIEFGIKEGIQVRFIELMTIGENIDYLKEKYIGYHEAFKDIDYKEVRKDNSDASSYYEYSNTGYEFGIISAMSNHFCNRCNRIRFTSKGKLRLCLHSDNDIDINDCLSNKELLSNKILLCVDGKPEKHNMLDNKISRTNMNNIGG